MAAQTFGLRLFQTFELWGSHPKLRSPFPGTLCSLPMEYAFGKLPEHRVAAKRAASPFGIEDCVANSTSPFPPGPTYLQVLSGRPGARGSTLQGLREELQSEKIPWPLGFSQASSRHAQKEPGLPSALGNPTLVCGRASSDRRAADAGNWAHSLFQPNVLRNSV